MIGQWNKVEDLMILLMTEMTKTIGMIEMMRKTMMMKERELEIIRSLGLKTLRILHKVILKRVLKVIMTQS